MAGPLDTLQRKIEDMRFRGFGGDAIHLHRAIKHFKLSRSNILLAVLLPPVFNLILLAFLGGMLGFWEASFDFWIGKLAPGAAWSRRDLDLGYYMASVPYPVLPAGEPGFATMVITTCVVVMLFLSTFLMKRVHLLPVSYILRACCLIQCSALLYFYLLPGTFPHDAASALGDALGMAVNFLFLIPWLLGMTYYIFDFSLWQKMGLTLMMLLYFAVAVPMQYLAHAFILQHFSLLFLPLLYLVFGVFIDIMMFVALYSFGMSWQRPDRSRQPGML